jgi:hypothetical protein
VLAAQRGESLFLEAVADLFVGNFDRWFPNGFAVD